MNRYIHGSLNLLCSAFYEAKRVLTAALEVQAGRYSCSLVVEGCGRHSLQSHVPELSVHLRLAMTSFLRQQRYSAFVAGVGAAAALYVYTKVILSSNSAVNARRSSRVGHSAGSGSGGGARCRQQPPLPAVPRLHLTFVALHCRLITGT